MAFGLAPDGSDLPIRAALPVLLRNAIRRLAVTPAQPLKPFYRAGEEVRPRVVSAVYEDAEFSRSIELRRSALLEGHHSPLDASFAGFNPFRVTGTWPTAPVGWPWIMAMWPPPAGSAEPQWTATVDLDPSRDITP